MKESKLMQRIHRERERRWQKAGKNFNNHFQLIKKKAQKVMDRCKDNYNTVSM